MSTATPAALPSPGTLLVKDSAIHTVSPEGVTASMSLESLFASVAGLGAEATPTVLPDGIKLVLRKGPLVVWVHQCPPRVRRVRWIDPASKVQFGPGTKYRHVSIALPYVIVFAVFMPLDGGRVLLAKHNECFFRNAPLASASDRLFYPALLNCSKQKQPEQALKPLSWICTQHMDRGFELEPDVHLRQRLAFGSLMACLYDAGFNYSSEHHEASSWWTESRGVDPRIADVEAWQQASVRNPLFVLDLPWLPVAMNVAQVAERIFSIHRGEIPELRTAKALSRFVLNRGEASLPPPAAAPATLTATQELQELLL